MTMALEFRNLDILFPPASGGGSKRRIKAALDLLDSRSARAEIADKTG